jgi:hypothetical protein
MTVCFEPFGEEVARGAQFIGAEESDEGPLDSIADEWYRRSSDVNRLARQNPGAALGAGLLAGVLIGFLIGAGRS